MKNGVFRFLVNFVMLFLVNYHHSTWAKPQKQSNRPLKKASSGPSSSNLWVKDVSIKGTRKIETKAVLMQVTHPKSQPLDPAKVRVDLERIYQLGFFKDVWVDYDSDSQTLTYHVVEKPIIREIVYEGLKSFKTEDFKDVIEVKSLDFLDEGKLSEMAEKIRKFYESKGYLLARVGYRVERLDSMNSVKVVFLINEGSKVKIRRIHFVGNRFWSSQGLKARLSSSETGFLSFISGSGELKMENIERDTQIIRYLYLNEGFVNIRVDQPEIQFSQDGRWADVIFRVTEGERYRVGDIDFGGDLLVPVSELQGLVTLKSGEYFSYDALQKDLNQLAARYGDMGYAYVNVIPRTRLDETEKVVDIRYEFEKGPLVTVGRINIQGNTKTLDRVIRREMRLLEGTLYNETNRRRSFENVQRLGFFDDVQFRTRSRLQDQKDFMDIDVVVKERNTGALQFGAGYGTVTGFTLQGSVNQINFLGKGQRLSANINSSRVGAFYSISFTDPSWDDSDYLIGVDISQSGIDRFEYQERRTGGAIRLGRRFDDYSFGNIRYRLENVRLSPYIDPNGTLLTDLSLFPLSQSSGWLSSFSISYDYDRRDDRFLPSEGQLLSLSFEYAGLGGNLHFAKSVASYRYYHRVYKDLIWRNNWTYGLVFPTQSGIPVPVNERFLLGGPFSLRGYRFFRVGGIRYSSYLKSIYSSNLPPDRAEELAYVPVGGSQQFLWQSELEFPLIKDAGIRWVTFFDVGQAEDQLSWNEFYSNWGFGIRWFSPLGPLRFEWGFPLRRIVTSQDPVVFEFSIGTPF